MWKNFIKKIFCLEENVAIDVALKCPDGLYESLGFDLPKDINSFVKFINTFSKDKQYLIQLKKFDLLKTIAQLKE